MDATTIQNLNQHSFAVEKMAKGYKWTIKMYGSDINKLMEEVKKANENAKALYETE